MNWLTAGPRGRRLLYELLDLEPGSGADLAAQLAKASRGESTLLEAFERSVDAARYWQEPDDVDLALAQPEVGDALSGLAAEVAADPDAEWWGAPVALGDQHAISWADEPSTSWTGAADELASWRTATVEDEVRARQRPTDLTANWTGRWWSTPTPSALTSTTRAVDGVPVGLRLVEDAFGWRATTTTHVHPQDGVRVVEIDGPQAWVDLVHRYPLVVTSSRRHDWWHTTGGTGPWWLVDLHAAAVDLDAVHLTARGYLETAGRALETQHGQTVVAGWHPDRTWWLADVLTPGATTSWERADDWVRSGP